MSCCKHEHDNENKQGVKHKSHMSHLWMMILCCAAPLLILMLLPFIGNFIPGAAGFVGKIVPFLCPLLMIPMVILMMRDGRIRTKEEE